MNAVCRHFGACGGCTLQDLSAGTYREHKRNLIVGALARCGIGDAPLREIAAVPQRSRRRASLKIVKKNGETHIGFHARQSHDLVHLQECHVLTPGLFSVMHGMPGLLSPLLRDNSSREIYLVEADNGFDLAISGLIGTVSLTPSIARVAEGLKMVRAVIGSDLVYDGGSPEITFGKARVELPPRAFLQPTREGETMLQTRVIEAVGSARKIIDLFSGCGTFSLRLAERALVHAVDADAPMLDAMGAAARQAPGLKPVSTEKRDLFKRPIAQLELDSFDAVVLDPPRAGAFAQVNQLAKSRIGSIAYVSCDAASFARDARVLVDGGFRLDWIVGVDQFLWSAHIELVAAFSRN